MDQESAETIAGGLAPYKGASIPEMLEGLAMSLAGEGLGSPVGVQLDELVGAQHGVASELSRVADGLESIADAIKAHGEQQVAETFCATCGHLDQPGVHWASDCTRYQDQVARAAARRSGHGGV